MKSIETEDSYLIDTFKHFYDETELCLEIILKRLRIQQNLISAQKNLDKAKMTGKDIPIVCFVWWGQFVLIDCDDDDDADEYSMRRLLKNSFKISKPLPSHLKRVFI